jgi:hypothetical protein
MNPLAILLYLSSALSGALGVLMLVWSYGWKARLYRTQWDYRFTAAVFGVFAAVALGAAWYVARR